MQTLTRRGWLRAILPLPLLPVLGKRAAVAKVPKSIMELVSVGGYELEPFVTLHLPDFQFIGPRYGTEEPFYSVLEPKELTEMEKRGVIEPGVTPDLPKAQPGEKQAEASQTLPQQLAAQIAELKANNPPGTFPSGYIPEEQLQPLAGKVAGCCRGKCKTQGDGS